MNSIEKQGMTFEDALGVLAQAQAEHGRLGKIVSTKDPDSLRRACDEEMRLRYELQGVKSIDVKVGGEKVATYTAAVTREEPERRVRRLEVPDDAAAEWLEHAVDNGWLMEWLRARARDIAMSWMEETGELIDGAEMVEETVPAKPSMFRNTVLKVYEEKLDRALAAQSAKELEGVES